MAYVNRIVRGSCHQGHLKFGFNGGKQCVANVQSFFIFSAFESCENITTETIDKILDAGNDIYSSARRRSGYNLLLPTDLPHVVGIDEKLCRIEPVSIIYGVIKPDLEELNVGLSRMFTSEDRCFFTCKETCVGLFTLVNKLYLFDSHARDSRGLTHSRGVSCVLEFKSLVNLANYLKTQYGQVNGERF